MANGQQSTSGQGAVGYGLSIALIGISLSSATGLLTPNIAGSVPLLGLESLAETGTIGAPVDVTGQAATSALGSVTPGLRPTDVVGQSISGAQGTLTILDVPISVNLSGVVSVSAQGAVRATPVLAGEVGTLATGIPIPDLSFPITGLSLTAAQAIVIPGQEAPDTLITSASGTLTAADSSVPLVGSVSTSAPGTVSTSPDAEFALTGLASTSAAGTPVAGPALPLVGANTIAEQGQFGAPGSSPLTGEGITSGQGTVFTVNDRTQAMTGSASAVSAGTIAAAMGVVLTGQAEPTGQGTMDRSGGNMALPLTGAAITTAAGTLGAVAPTVVPPGVQNEGCGITSAVVGSCVTLSPSTTCDTTASSAVAREV